MRITAHEGVAVTELLGLIGDCIRELHEAALHVGPGDYRAWALRRIREQIPCEAAWWVVAAPDSGGGMHDAVACGLAAGAVPRIEDVVCAPAYECRYLEAASTQRMGALVRFVRPADAPEFSAEERELLALFASHACSAWRAAERLCLLRNACTAGQASALADRAGGVRAVLGNFYAAVRASWPEWRGGPLPTSLRAAFRPGAALLLRGHRWNVTECDGLLRITALPLGPVAMLTAREKAVAAAVLDAGSQRVAAARLRISANTVRNTLVRVYAKLGVRDRVELALRFRHELVQPGRSHA